MAAPQLRQLQLKLEADATAFRDIQKGVQKRPKAPARVLKAAA